MVVSLYSMYAYTNIYTYIETYYSSVIQFKKFSAHHPEKYIYDLTTLSNINLKYMFRYKLNIV